MKRRTVTKDKSTSYNNDNELVDNQLNSSASDGSTASSGSDNQSSDSEIDISSNNNQSVLTAEQSSKSKGSIKLKHLVQPNRSSKSKSTRYFRWKEQYLRKFKWLRYDHVSGVAHCCHYGCNMYYHYLN